MKEVLYRIFEANPSKKDIQFNYVHTRTEHYFEISTKSNDTRLHYVDFYLFENLGKGEQQAFINMINAILDWYNLQP
jgi:hypothetical protein